MMHQPFIKTVLPPCLGIQVHHMSRTNDDEQWEDLVRRLGGEPEDSALDPSSYFSAPPPGPRDYHVTEEVSEDFQPPSPKPIATGNPRTILSWTAVLGSVVIWLS